jgi:hypothetical protein
MSVGPSIPEVKKKPIIIDKKTLKKMQARSRMIDRSSKVKIEKIIELTPNKMHAWVKTNIGVIRKPMSKIPDAIKQAYANQ